MIARYWRGWTRPENAQAYEKLLKEKVLPALKTIPVIRAGMFFAGTILNNRNLLS